MHRRSVGSKYYCSRCTAAAAAAGRGKEGRSTPTGLIRPRLQKTILLKRTKENITFGETERFCEW